MQVSRDEKLIKRRSQFGTYATLAGLVVLVVGMIISFRSPQYIWVSMLALLVGFLLSQYGNYNLRRWGRSPRPDQVLENSLKGFDDRYHYYAWTLPTPHVVLSPQGLYVLTTRDQTGDVSVKGSEWHSKFTLGKALMFFAAESLGNPIRDASEEAAKLQKWLQAQAPDIKVPIQPVVVFIDERVRLQVSEPALPVLEAKGLKKWLRGTGKGENIKAPDYKALELLLHS